jgi:DNA topoisomerase IB
MFSVPSAPQWKKTGGGQRVRSRCRFLAFKARIRQETDEQKHQQQQEQARAANFDFDVLSSLCLPRSLL